MNDVQKFKVTGLTCVACTKLTAKRLKTLPGVKDATVDLATGKAEAQTTQPVTLHDVKEALSASGYDAEEYHA